MFLNYFALGVLIFVFLVLFYGIIAIHDIPYNMAKKRNHPHADAIHTAGWISLFTLHAIWPFLWIWATLYREDRGWGMQNHITKPDEVPGMDALAKRVAELEQKLAAVSQLIRTRWSANHGSVDYFDLCGICLGHF
jgi:hypothetical protein